jgi:hypothetical protein
VKGTTASQSWAIVDRNSDVVTNHYPNITGAKMPGNRKSGAAVATLSITGISPLNPSTHAATAAVALNERGSLVYLASGAALELAVDNVILKGISEGHTEGGITIPVSDPPLDNNKPLVHVGPGNTFEMRGSAELTGNWSARYTHEGDESNLLKDTNQNTIKAGAACVEGGIFRMSGSYASVHHNGSAGAGYLVSTLHSYVTFESAGGILARDAGQVIIAGEYAEVSSNVGFYHTGGVKLMTGSYFEMSGTHAKISGNYGYSTGGLYLFGRDDPRATSIGVMSGEYAEVSSNSGGTGGSTGGVLIGRSAQFTLSGAHAQISGNTGRGEAGGVHMSGGDSVFTMTGGEIFGNRSTGWLGTIIGGGGGGVRVNPDYSGTPPVRPTFIMKSGTIYGYSGGTNASGVQRAGNEVDRGDTTQDGYGPDVHTAALSGEVSLPLGGTLDGVSIIGGTQGSTSDTIRAP